MWPALAFCKLPADAKGCQHAISATTAAAMTIFPSVDGPQQQNRRHSDKKGVDKARRIPVK